MSSQKNSDQQFKERLDKLPRTLLEIQEATENLPYLNF